MDDTTNDKSHDKPTELREQTDHQDDATEEPFQRTESVILTDYLIDHPTGRGGK